MISLMPVTKTNIKRYLVEYNELQPFTEFTTGKESQNKICFPDLTIYREHSKLIFSI